MKIIITLLLSINLIACASAPKTDSNGLNEPPKVTFWQALGRAMSGAGHGVSQASQAYQRPVVCTQQVVGTMIFTRCN